MSEFNPIRDLMPVDSSRESVDKSSEQIKVIETKLIETKNGVSNLLNIIKTKNSLLDKDLGKIKSLNLRLKRTIPRIPILPGIAGVQFGELAEAERKSKQGGGTGGFPFRSLAALSLLGLLNRKPESKPKVTFKNKNVKKVFQTLNTAKDVTVGVGAGVGITRSGKGLFRTIKKKIISGDGKVRMLGIGELLKSIFKGNKNPIKKKIVKPDTPKVNFFEKMFFQNKEPNKFNIKVNPTRVDLSKSREQIRLENIRRTLNEAKTVIPIRKPRVNRENFFNRGTVKNSPFTGPQDLFKRTRDDLKRLLEKENKLQKIYETLIKNRDFKSIQKFLRKQVPKDKYDKIIEGGRKIKKRNMINSPDKNTTENIKRMQDILNLGGKPKDLSSLQASPNNMDLASLNTDTGITNTVIILTGTA
tara:strand:+ start:84 stop:1331 length:1248 start_codon:yes stop_codon:yes gene_type:complete